MTKSVSLDTLAVHANRITDAMSGSTLNSSTLNSSTLNSKLSTNLDTLETRLAALEQAGWALAFTSESAALDAIFRLVRPGERIVTGAPGHAAASLLAFMAESGIVVDLRDLADPETWRFRKTRLIYLELPSGVNLDILDVPTIQRRARDVGAIVVVNATALSPIIAHPLEFGADLVVHNLSALAGTTQQTIGAVLGHSKGLQERLEQHRLLCGTTPSALDAQLVGEGTRTASLRVRVANHTALELAQRLLCEERVRVVYPGSEAHSSFGISRRLFRNMDGTPLECSGATLHLRFESKASAERFCQALELILFAEGQTLLETRAEHVTMMNGPLLDETIFAIPDDLVRLSIGIEDPEDLWNDLAQAIEMAYSTEALEQDVRVGESPVLSPADEAEDPPTRAKSFEPAKEDPISTLSIPELECYARLRYWRDNRAASLGLGRLIIASNATLAKLAKAQPANPEALEQICPDAEYIWDHSEEVLEALHGSSSKDLDLPIGEESMSLQASDQASD